MTTALSTPLPPMQAAWLEEILEGPIPAETRATCDDCAMCNDVAAGASSFNPETKCCTYTPALANFLVGQVLADPDTSGAGRASVSARIAAGVAVTPLGLGAPAVAELLYRHGAAGGFGLSRALRCPHYVEEGGLCGIWRQRNAVCATWFCKHVRGATSSLFWERVKQLLSFIEGELAIDCLLELGVGPAALARLFPPSARRAGLGTVGLALSDLESRGDPVAAKAIWGTWAGREAEFYEACARRVDGADLAQILRRSGPEARVRVALVRDAWQRLSEEPPARLRPGQLHVIGAAAATCRVTTYSAHDPLEMPRALFDVLHHFDGRPTEEVLRAIEDAGGPRLSAGLVRKMSDFGVLEPAADEVTPFAGVRARRTRPSSS